MMRAMARPFSTSGRFDVPARALFELYGETRFQEEKALAMGALSARATRSELPSGTVQMVLEMTRPRHGGGGGEEQAVMTMDLDPQTFGSQWKQVVKGQESRARVEGTSSVQALDEHRCELRVDGTIEIKVPLLGRMIERKIVDAIERDAHKETSFIEAALRERGLVEA